MKLLSLVLIIAIGSTGLADETNEDDRHKRLKQGVIIGGVVVGAIVGWRILRHANYKLHEKYVDGVEKIARRSRMPLSEFTKVEITDPPIYRLTAPDGSQHHILGTMHISNLSLSDFAKDSKLFPILEQANILMPERVKTPLTSALKLQFSYAFNRQRRQMFTSRPKLSEQLGEQRWQKLTQMIAEKPDLKPFEQPLDEFIAKIDTSPADDVYRRLLDYGFGYATPVEGLMMDYQLMRYGRQHGKTLIGLETFKQVTSALKKIKSSSSVDDLKELIDKGGIDYITDTTIDLVHGYADGKKTDELYQLWTELTPQSVKAAGEKFLLDQRNIAWVESGKIQKNCVQGNRCLIFVGLGHLVKTDNTLIKLLRERGYQIERL